MPAHASWGWPDMTASAAVNGKIYVVGRALNYPQNYCEFTTEEYNPVTDTWTSRAWLDASFPYAGGSRSCLMEYWSPGMAVVDGKIIYIVAGAADFGVGTVSTTYQYDPGTDTWTSRPDLAMPFTPRYGRAATVDGHIYVIGGLEYVNENFGRDLASTAVWDLDIASGTWSTRAPLPNPRVRMDVAVRGGLIYIVGGEGYAGSDSTLVEIYDPVLDSFSIGPSLTVSRRGRFAVAVGGTIYLVGGYHFDGPQSIVVSSVDVLTESLVDVSPPALTFRVVTPALNAPVPHYEIAVVPATSLNGAAVGFVALALDDVDGSFAADCVPAAGAVFPLGTTVVTCAAADAAGNAATAQYQVTVVDTPPEFTFFPESLTVEATAPLTPVTYEPIAFDAVDGVLPVTCTPSSGTGFAVRQESLVSCVASDSRGQPISLSFTVTVVDTTPPTIIGTPESFSVEATGPGGAIADYTRPSSFDAASGRLVDLTVDGYIDPAIPCSPGPGSLFPIGQTTVTCSARVGGRRTTNVLPASTSFVVTVVDTTPPVLLPPGDLIVDATSPAGAVVTFAASAVDQVDGAVVVTCAPASGEPFGVGTTTVSCTATDAAGNTTTGGFVVTVRGAAELATDLVSLVSQLNLAQAGGLLDNALEQGPGSPAGCNTLTAFSQQVSAQAGKKKLTESQASALLAAAESIRAAGGCR